MDVDRPRLLLVPQLTELTWTIKPRLEDWAEVASYDAPGVGAEPPREIGYRSVAERGLEELERRGWDSFVIAVDGLATPIGVEIAAERRDDVLGLVLGHAALSTRRTGPRPPINAEVFAGALQLLSQDREGFIRAAIVQVTGGSYTEELATAMLERIRTDLVEEAYLALSSEVDYGSRLRGLGAPLLLAKHEGCLLHTDEGYKDIVAAFPEAMAVTTPDACCTDPAFADAIREFCQEVLGAERR